MAENRFKQFMPVDQQDDEQIKSNNRFKMFMPDDASTENKFNISNEIDNKSLYKNIELDSNRFNFLIPDEAKPKENIKLFSDEATDFTAGDAFLLGLGDTLRGVTQFAGGDKKLLGLFEMEYSLEEQQKRLNAAMQRDGGGLIAAAYFGGAILDPLQWLIPVTRAKTLYQMAKFGAVSGGLAGALGYVDEQSLFDTRSKQAFGGALGGAIISPVIGKGVQALKVRKLKKSFGLDEDAPDIKNIPEKDLVKVKLPGDEDITIGVAGKRGKKVKGRGEEIVQIRKNIKIKSVETVNDTPTAINKNKQNNKSFILRGPREFFKTILGAYVEPVKAGQKFYREKIGKPAFDYFTAEKGLGPEIGSGLIGGAYGFSLPEEDGDATKDFLEQY